MITVNGKKLAENNEEFINSLFETGDAARRASIERTWNAKELIYRFK